MDLASYQTGTAFADLICADAEWLRAEFDALISASFSQPPTPPPPAPPRFPPHRRPTCPVTGPLPGCARWAHTFTRAAPGHRRQRSPPA